MLDDMLAYTVVGTRDTVAAGLRAIVERTGADELMVASQIFDHEARVRSYEIVAEGWEGASSDAALARTAGMGHR